MFLRADKDTLESLVNQRFVSPGPTYYQEKSTFGPKNRIITGSLAGPKEIKEDLGFGTARRFQQTQTTTPGPSEYTTTTTTDRLPAKPLAPPKLSKPKGIFSCPSIPTARNIIGAMLEGRTELQKQQVDSKGLTATTRAPPAYSFPKSEYPTRQPILVQEFEAQDGQTREYMTNQIQWTGNKQSDILQQTRQDLELQRIKQQNNRRKRELLDLVLNNTSSVPSLEVLQMRKKFIAAEVPGPGFYDFKRDTVQVKNSGHMFTGFASNIDRFMTKDPFPTQGPGKYSYQHPDKKPTSFTFGREKKQAANPIRRQQMASSEGLNIKREKLPRQNSEPFGSSTVRFSSQPREKPLPEPTKQFHHRLNPQALRKLRKSISTNETMESDIGNLQSVDVLFHIYGNN